MAWDSDLHDRKKINDEVKYKGRRSPVYEVTKEDEANPFFLVDFVGRMDEDG
jgi:hypothetical protein